MKKFYYLLASMAFLLVVIMACEKSAIGVDEIQTVKDDVLLSKGEKPVKVTICHYDADLEESYQITISENGLNGHEGHEFDEIPELDGEVYTPLSDRDDDGIIDCADCYPDNETMGEKMTWYMDADSDGFGDPDVYIKTCDVRDGYVADNTDCDDSTAAILGEYIFEWAAPNGYMHYVNIDSYNPGDGTFTGSGYFIFISHSSGWADGNEPLTVSGTYDKDEKTFEGILDYTNDGAANFNGTASGCDGLTGTNILIYPYADGDGDGFSIDEGDCDDTNATVNPGAVEICNDGIDNNCDGNTDENDFSFEGEHVFYYTLGGTIYPHRFEFSALDGINFTATGYFPTTEPYKFEYEMVGTLDGDSFEIHTVESHPTWTIIGTFSVCDGFEFNSPWSAEEPI